MGQSETFENKKNEENMKKDIRHLDLNTPDGAQLNMDALYQIAPSAFTIAGTPLRRISKCRHHPPAWL